MIDKTPLDYHVIAERDHTIMNPMSPEKLDRLIDYCRIADGMGVLDIGCGKAWLLRRIAEKFAIQGVGIDTRDAFLDVARAAIKARALKGNLELITSPALSYADPRKFDVSLCIGAPFAIGTFVEAVDWLIARTKPHG
ncbi:MAG: methyltransferase domain-containing protein, partial [Alphaproteobacteria bacterium]